MFEGVNRLQNRNDLPESEATDTANAFLFKGRKGVLGARKGKTFTATTAYGDIVVGRAKFELPSGVVASVATNNGEQTTTDRAQATIPTLYLTGDTATGKALATSSFDLDYPNLTAALNTTFNDASTYDPEASIYISWGNALGLTGNGGWSGATKLRVELGANVNGVAKYLFTFDWTTDFSGSYALAGAVPAAVHAANDTIIGACFRISWPDGAWPTGAGAGDKVTLSSLLAG